MRTGISRIHRRAGGLQSSEKEIERAMADMLRNSSCSEGVAPNQYIYSSPSESGLAGAGSWLVGARSGTASGSGSACAEQLEPEATGPRSPNSLAEPVCDIGANDFWTVGRHQHTKPSLGRKTTCAQGFVASRLQKPNEEDGPRPRQVIPNQPTSKSR